jgi:hypothetical protein
MHPARRIRASDAEREATVALLQTAASEGRLTLDEFSQRSHLAYAATSRDQLAGLVADLPPARWTPPPRPPQPSPIPLLAMILGIVGIFAIACMPLGFLASVAGIALGAIGLAQIRSGTVGSRAMARAGLFCGAIGVLLQFAVVAVLAVVPS